MVSFACEKYEMFLLQFIYEKQQQHKKKPVHQKKFGNYSFSSEIVKI